MNKDYVVIRPDMPVFEASKTLISKNTLGGPVVDNDGQLIGWLSEQECLKVTIQVVYLNQRVATVKDVMSRDVLTVGLHDDPLKLAEQMLNNKPKNYPVLNEQKRVVGVLSRRQLLTMLINKMDEV